VTKITGGSNEHGPETETVRVEPSEVVSDATLREALDGL